MTTSAPLSAPNVKRLVDLVDRGPEDDVFYPATSNNTIFNREFRPYHNVVSEIADIGYLGDAGWGKRISVLLKPNDTGDLIQWVCLRIAPASWLGPVLESKLQNGLWDYSDSAKEAGTIWTWAASLGSIAIQTVEFIIGDAVVETWTGEWMDIWSRTWLDAGRSGTWDADIYGQRPHTEIRRKTEEPFTTFRPTEDGHVYCWIPLAFFKYPKAAFPLVSLADGPTRQNVQLNITFRPFSDVVRMKSVPRTDPCQVPLGSSIVLVDKTGPTPVPWSFTLPTAVPGFNDLTVMVGVVHTEDPLRSELAYSPAELLYEPVQYMRFELPPAIQQASLIPFTASFYLDALNGPIRELCFFLRRTGVWQFNEWTNYGALSESDFFPTFAPVAGVVPIQRPLLVSAKLMVGNAVWRDESEFWWRTEYALEHRGGVRLSKGMVYGISFGAGATAGATAGAGAGAGTVNASRTRLRLDLTMLAPVPTDGNVYVPGWDVHVFGSSYNWMKFTQGLAVPLFK